MSATQTFSSVKPLTWIARHSGISYNRVRMLKAGFRERPGHSGTAARELVTLKHPEQYTLEMLAAYVELARQLDV
nr:hypothetical protein [uncultured Ralstonia sp.]